MHASSAGVEGAAANEANLQGRARAGELTALMLQRGTTTRSRQQIQDELDRLRANLRVGGSADLARLTLEVPRQQLDPALRLVGEMLRQPAFSPSELALLVEEQVASLEDSRRDPFQQAFTAINRHLEDWPPAGPRYVATPDETIAGVRGVTVEELRRFHADFYGASAAELAAVGDFDSTALEALVGELFGGWRSASSYQRLARRQAGRLRSSPPCPLAGDLVMAGAWVEPRFSRVEPLAC